MKASMESDRYNAVECQTNNSTWFKYGLLEISVKIKNNKGQGAGFWLLGNTSQDYYAEIDIYESSANFMKFTPLSWVSKSVTDAASGTYYCDFHGDIGVYEGGTQGDTYYRFENDDKAEYFHTVGIEWTDSYIAMVVDGRVFMKIDTTVDERAVKTFNDFLQIRLAHGGGQNTGGVGWPDETTDWENNYSIFDYIRLYQTPQGELKKLNRK